MRIVMKFGGTSVGSAGRVEQMAAIVQRHAARGDEVVVVLSAMNGVTNLLLSSAREAAAGQIESLGERRRELSLRHGELVTAQVRDETARKSLAAAIERSLDGFESLCRSIHVLGELTPRASDAVACLGERLMIPIAAQVLRELGVPAEPIDATELIVTDDCFGCADPIADLTRDRSQARLVPLLTTGIVPVTTGFLGATISGTVTTLGRGGSDYTATILGNALDADEVWIWTDVNGVMTTDPRIVPEAVTLAEISYAEAAELAFFGAKVIHPKTILPAAEKNIPIRILNSFDPLQTGTLIVRSPQAASLRMRAITAIRNLSLVTVEGRGMIGVPGVAGRVFSTVAHEGINVLMISQSSSEQNICFAVETLSAPRALAALQREFELERIRQNIEDIVSQDRIVIVAVVGARMKGIPGIAARVFGALAAQDINVIAIAQGSSEYNLSLVVDEKDADDAVRAIHRAFQMGSA